ncbi:hypothetical protein J2Y54_000540 [Sphingomonas sp. BE123]|uniref:hypothetical protein n=1 Tax=Sphingomonas sp. BE123 TaxID=2817842 RepID=UPI0028652116|nr:hypothetical protein [Sphingomonas sp. BE123]MDR6851047.1 hypothetical protein [Sphingomonas sp. BE123]
MTDQPPRAYDIGQPDYDPAIGHRLAICLDGELQSDVFAFDANAGWVRRNARDGSGNLIIDRDPDRVRTETVAGTVTVEWKQPMRARCGDCDEVWTVLHLPMPLEQAAELMIAARCPGGCTGKVFCA